ncbi:MAG: hypothetical protein HY332_20815 [Chloroflexi bacterium]|nr:hypothetical protein [Chloroflexota bacterium]
MPKTHATSIVVSRDELIGATRFAALFARNVANLMHIQAIPGEGGALTAGKLMMPMHNVR